MRNSHRTATHLNRGTTGQGRVVTGLSQANQSPYGARRDTFLRGLAQVPDGYAVCDVCYRIKPLRKSDGRLQAHNHCPGAPATLGTHPQTGVPMYAER